MLSRIRRTTAILAVLILATAFAQAQKPVATKAVDEPGRTPYGDTQTPICASSICAIHFKVVPAGFRLVVTYVSVRYQAADTNYAYLTQEPFNGYIFLPPPVLLSSLYYIISAPVSYFVEPGSIPVVGVTDALVTTPAYASLTGYLVAIP